MKLAMRIGVLFSLLTGCREKPVEPQQPGTSIPLTYPVLIAGRNRLTVVDDEMKLTTTTGASGVSFLEMQLIDSSGAIYRVPKVSDFGKKSWILDAGTGQYRIHLQLKLERRADLRAVREIVLAIVRDPSSIWSGFADGPRIAAEKLNAATDLAGLIEACRTAWSWR